MDLVSSTLDKYLKHRFNGVGMIKTSVVETTATTNGEIKSVKDTSTSNGTEISDNNLAASASESEEDFSGLPTQAHHISMRGLRPCCASVSHEIQFLAFGFENSHILLHVLKSEVLDETKEDSTKESESRNGEPDRMLNPGVIGTSSSKLKIIETSRLLAHYGPVYSIKFVKNNDLMLSCSEDTTIRLWCLKTKCNLAIYRGHNYPVWSLVVGPSREYFASSSMDATARLWRFDQLTPLRIFCGHDEDVECVEFHPNSKYLATGSSDTTVRLWSIAEAKMVRLMVGHKAAISSLSFIPDGKFLASADASGCIKIWNLATNIAVNDVSVPASRAISFNAEQNFIATCGLDNVLQLWKLTSSKAIELKRLDFNKGTAMLLSAVLIHNRLFVISFEDAELDERMMSNVDTSL